MKIKRFFIALFAVLFINVYLTSDGIAYAQQEGLGDAAEVDVTETPEAYEAFNEEIIPLDTAEGEADAQTDEGGSVDTTATDNPAPAEENTPVYNEGWNQLENGDWKYYNNGSFITSDWVKVNSRWYYLDDNGVMVKGWLKLGGNVYYLNPASGAMLTGVQNINGLNEKFSGSGVYNGPSRNSKFTGWARGGPDWKWYYLRNGNVARGWVKPGGSWYFMKQDGTMAENEWVRSGNSWYFMRSGGLMAQGWAKAGDNWYYLKPGSGVMQTGWLKRGSAWYYLDGSGAMVENRWMGIGGKWYYFRSSGEMATGWAQVGEKWFYLKPGSGVMQTGWLKLGSGPAKWYFLHGDGSMATGWLTVGSKKYYFTENGQMQTYWKLLDSKWYYFQSSGAMVSGKYRVGSKDYYFTVDGELIEYGDVSKGIDVSDYQKDINWTDVKNSGMADFAMIRALRCEPTAGPNGTPRYSIDASFEKNVREAKSNGIKIGAYLVTYAFNRDDMRKEIELFVNSAEVQRLKASGITFDFPVFIDIEYSGILTGNPSYDSRTDVLRYGMDLLRQYGYIPGFYSNMNWANNHYNASQLSNEGYHFWLARYPGDPYQKPENKPKQGDIKDAIYSIWQYTSQGAIAGIAGAIDMNFGYVKF